MGASFPNSIPSFSTKRNLLDDVDASDINRLQEEVVALASMLGVLINEIEDLEDDGTTIRTRFRNLKERLLWNQRGYHIPAIELSQRDKNVAKTEFDLGQKPKVLKMDAPPPGSDPMRMYDGSGFKIRADGFWMIQGHVRYRTAEGAGADNEGLYEASVMVNDNWARGADRGVAIYDNAPKQKDLLYQNVFLNPILTGWFNKGDQVRLGVLQSSHRTQNIGQAWLSGYLIRHSFENLVYFPPQVT